LAEEAEERDRTEEARRTSAIEAVSAAPFGSDRTRSGSRAETRENRKSVCFRSYRKKKQQRTFDFWTVCASLVRIALLPDLTTGLAG